MIPSSETVWGLVFYTMTLMKVTFVVLGCQALYISPHSGHQYFPIPVAGTQSTERATV